MEYTNSDSVIDVSWTQTRSKSRVCIFPKRRYARIFTALLLLVQSLSPRYCEESPRESIHAPKMNERRWSAPTTPITWEDIRPRFSDATFRDHSTCSDTAVDETNKAYEEMRILTADGPEPIQDSPHCFMKCSHDACKAFILSHMNADIIREHECHECTNLAPQMTISNMNKAFVAIPAPVPASVDDFRLQLYALEIRSLTQRAMDDLISSGGTEPFPAYREVDYIDGIDPYSSEPESAVAALQSSIEAFDRHYHPRSNRSMPSDDERSMLSPIPRSPSNDEQGMGKDMSSSNASPFISSNSTQPSTRPSTFEAGATDKPKADCLGDRRVRRREGCYFSTSENARGSNGELLITEAWHDREEPWHMQLRF